MREDVDADAEEEPAGWPPVEKDGGEEVRAMPLRSSAAGVEDGRAPERKGCGTREVGEAGLITLISSMTCSRGWRKNVEGKRHKVRLGSARNGNSGTANTEKCGMPL